MELRQKLHGVAKWAAYLGLLVFMYVMQCTPDFFTFFGVSPIFLVPFCISVALFEMPLTAAVIGALSGLLWDLSAVGSLFGFYGVLLMFSAMFVSLWALHFLRPRWEVAALLSSGAVLICLSLYLLFGFILWGVEGTWALFLHWALPTVLLTALITVPIFWACRRVCQTFL